MNILKQLCLNGILLSLLLPVAAPCFAVEADKPAYSFDKAPYIHPKIVEDLSAWMSDEGDQVVAINLLDSMGSNRYFGDIKVKGKENPFVFYEKTEESEKSSGAGPSSFGYRFVGKTTSGIIVLLTESSGGGTGQFRNLLFVTLEHDKGLSYDEKKNVLRADRERLLIRKLGEVPLGDRYEGKLSVKGNKVLIGKDTYSRSAGAFRKDTVLTLENVR